MSIEFDPASVTVGAHPIGVREREDVRIADFFRAPEDRLDERTRTAIARVIEASVEAIATDLADRATATGLSPIAATVPGADLRLRDALLRRDHAVMAAFVAQARLDLIDEGLPAAETPLPDDAAVRALSAEGGARLLGRRAMVLPVALERRLSWWVAALLREPAGAASDPALMAAVTAHLAAVEQEAATHAATATQAAAAMLAGRGVGEALLAAQARGRVALFVAVLAAALRCTADMAAAIVLDDDQTVLVTALHALGVDRVTIARIGWHFCEAEPARRPEALADAIDAVLADPARSAAAAARWTLDPDYRAAIDALASGAGA